MPGPYRFGRVEVADPYRPISKRSSLGLRRTLKHKEVSVQERDGAKSAPLGPTLSASRCRFVLADGPRFAGRLVEWRLVSWAPSFGKPKDETGFNILPRRWAAERTLAWTTSIGPRGCES